MTQLRTLTQAERETLRAAHDYSVSLGAECPDDCVFRMAELRAAEGDYDDLYEPLRPYDVALKALREKERDASSAPDLTAAESGELGGAEPPRGYDIALAKMRRASR